MPGANRGTCHRGQGGSQGAADRHPQSGCPFISTGHPTAGGQLHHRARAGSVAVQVDPLPVVFDYMRPLGVAIMWRAHVASTTSAKMIGCAGLGAVGMGTGSLDPGMVANAPQEILPRLGEGLALAAVGKSSRGPPPTMVWCIRAFLDVDVHVLAQHDDLLGEDGRPLGPTSTARGACACGRH